MLKRYLIHPKIECLFTEDEFVLLCEKLLLEQQEHHKPRRVYKSLFREMSYL